MWTPSGERLDALAFARRKRARAGRPRRVEEAAVHIRGKDDVNCHVRLIVVRKSAEATRRERQRIRREGSRKGKEPTARSLAAAAFTFLLTTVPAKDADAAVLAELYRVRWQVELGFKRWKSLIHLDALRAKDPALAKAYLLTKLLAALLADTLARAARAFPPRGLPLRTGPERLALVPLGG
jgi:IS4 transposase